MGMFKFVIKKPAETEATPPKKKKTDLKVIEGGKSKKKKKAAEAPAKKKKAAAAAKKGTKIKAKKGGGGGGASKHVVEASPKLEKLVNQVDSAIAAQESHKEKINAALSTLYDFLNENNGSSFKHPKHGLYSVMKRGNLFFWRPKPKGRG